MMQLKNLKLKVFILSRPVLFVIKLTLYLVDQDQWKDLFAKEHAAKVRILFFLRGLCRHSK